jgi:hypothetical protein
MKIINIFWVSIICCITAINSSAQTTKFPQQKINEVLSKASINTSKHVKDFSSIKNKQEGAFKCVQQMELLKQMDWEQIKLRANESRALDTIYVGALNDDTLVITGSFNHEGPIFVFNQGVLIIHNATLINEGDIYVFGQGQLLCDSSNLIFPQQYFYQRGLFAVHDALVYLKDVNFNYGGMQHNLVIGDSATVAMEHVHQNDWTTAGLFGAASIFVNGMNLGGEYILTDSSTSVFKHVDTLLLWHKFPQNSSVNHTFPQGDTVYNYYFSNLIPNVSGLNYANFTDSCHTVWWGIMPVNGSNVTLNNSNIRVAGAWFQFGDSISVTGIQNNTFYPNTLIPLPDRTLNMLNTFVQTWSFYVFDSSFVAIDNCTLGEVGTQQTSEVVAQDMLLDGSGGYFWATDTSFVYALNVTSYSTTRSERNSIFLLAYSEMPFSAPTATGNSLVISAQNNTAIDPIPYDGAIAWNQKVESPSVAHVDSLIPVVGSAWIHQGPNGSWMSFVSYSLHYQLLNATTWTPIVLDSLTEVSHDTLGIWNTSGLQAGDYVLKLTVKNNLGDSIETFVNVTLYPSVVANHLLGNALNVAVYPNPASSELNMQIEIQKDEDAMVYISDVKGQRIESYTKLIKMQAGYHQLNFKTDHLSNGLYFINLIGKEQSGSYKFSIQHGAIEN